MTVEEFEQAYAAESGTTVEWLREHGREAAPCDCDWDGCKGWQMVFVAQLRREVARGYALPRDREALAYVEGRRRE